MKKTFVAAAVLGALATTAFAADVTLYGVVDTGLKFTRTDSDIPGIAKELGIAKNTDALNKFEMKSGNQAGSRFGLKGTEDLGDGYKVGFILESGFNADDGSMGKPNVIFNREASLSLYTPFGQLSAGKIGAITQGTSSWGKMGYFSAFGTSYGDFVAQDGQIASTTQVWDNMIAYQTPSFAGVKVYAQYAMGAQDNENKSSSDRFYAVGATYDNGPAHLLFAVDSTNYKSWDAEEAKGIDTDDSLTVTLGGNWDFDVARVYFGGQYFKDVAVSSVGVFKAFGTAIQADLTTGAQSLADTTSHIDGYGLTASVSAPVLGGTSRFGVGYVDASESDKDKSDEFDLSAWIVSAGYQYDLSKRTNVYGVVSYSKAEYKNKTEEFKVKPSAAVAMVGLRHNF